jgi:DNA-binding transcriptional LysR family regulator
MARNVDWIDRIGRRLRLRDLHVFFAVVNAGSMAKAAAHLKITQPSVSKAISDLESVLGVRLFDRSPQGVAATIYGEALMKCGTVVFDELRQGIKSIEFLADPTVGAVKIGCPDTLGAAILPAIIQQFGRRHPRVVLYIDDVPPPVIMDSGLRERKYDVVFARTNIPVPESFVADDLNVEFLFDDPFVLAAGLHTRWARRREIDLAELIDEPWIMQGPDTWNYAFLTSACQARGLGMPKTCLVTTSEPLRTELLSTGSYITVLANSWVHMNARRYAFKALPVDLPVGLWPVATVTLKNRTLSPVVERFIQCAREVVKKLGHAVPRRQ